MSNNINKLHKFKISTKMLSILLCCVLSFSLFGVSFAFFAAKKDVEGSVFLSSGLVAEVQNLTIAENYVDVKQYLSPLNLYIKSIKKDYVVEENLFEYNPRENILNSGEGINISAGDVITLYNPTIRAGKGTRAFYLRSRFYAYVKNEQNEEVEIPSNLLIKYGIESIPTYDSTSWLYNDADKYYYNVVGEATTASLENFNLNYYNSEEDRSNLIKFFNEDNTKIVISKLNFNNSVLGKDIYFRLKIEFIEAENEEYIHNEWKI